MDVIWCVVDAVIIHISLQERGSADANFIGAAACIVKRVPSVRRNTRANKHSNVFAILVM